MNMEHARQEELNREMRQFAETTAAVLQDHKTALERHEENFLGAFRSAESHKLAIEELRQHLHSLAEVINQTGNARLFVAAGKTCPAVKSVKPSGTLTSLDICIRGVHCQCKVQVGQHYIHYESERVDGAHRVSERESL